jgi:hypothetical protein
MRLATVVGQTHGCYLLNKLSPVCDFVISTCFFKYQFVCVMLYRAQKYKIFWKK